MIVVTRPGIGQGLVSLDFWIPSGVVNVELVALANAGRFEKFGA